MLLSAASWTANYSGVDPSPGHKNSTSFGVSADSRLNEGVNVKDPREENGDAVSRHIRPKLETSDIGVYYA